ncbi:unnamed protein product [Thlaspi arvense]|uniref:Nucleoporin Nup133/Nup155-like N-terminal domain-containing protein n=1 Tax=Thlaspi arvense TaxID=13288 RepID=A0AAU9RVQ2_THLAR|nr:unnamed protein product [Thlaspi arvense]
MLYSAIAEYPCCMLCTCFKCLPVIRDGQCPEYSGEEQAMCAVGLVQAKAGIFVEAIQYLLILATPIELILVGVCCSRRDGELDPYAAVSLQPLPEYTMSSYGVTTTCISCTNKGIGTFGSISLAGRSQNEDLSLKIESKYYSAGTLVLSDSSPSTMSSLLFVNGDSSMPSSSLTNTGTGARSSRALEETIS